MGNQCLSTCRLLPCLFFLITLCCLSSNPGNAQNRQFSVQDSIEMSTFSDPYTRSPGDQCKLSPDGRYFFTITTRGNLATNHFQSVIWLYRTDHVLTFLRKRDAVAPRAELLLRITATPQAQQFDSYGSLITKAQWSSDSAGILFLAETGDGLRRLYKVDIRSREERLLSTKYADVEDFVEAAGTTVYVSQVGTYVRHGIDASALDRRISSVLTGRSLLNIFDPSEFSPTGTASHASDLWARRGNYRMRLNGKYGAARWHYPASATGFFHLALSPDGNGLIAAKPVSEVLPAWRHFVSLLPDFDFKKLSATETDSDRDWLWPWQYVYIDLRHHRTFPITEAPTAWMAGYGEPFEASWSPDGSRVLVTGTYLSPPSTSIPSGGEIPCAAAVFIVANKQTRCVAYTRFPKQESYLHGAQFGKSPNEVILQWSTARTSTQETYRQIAGEWRLVATEKVGPEQRGRFSVSVRQGLNISPALWAADPDTGVKKELWDPNPQLKAIRMGQASIYRWTDASGYEWKAGLVTPYGYIPGHPYPLVIQTHGFNEDEFLVDGSYTTGFAAQPLAAAGIMVLQMEDRSDRHHKGLSQEANLFAEGCASAIHQMAADGLIDPSRVGIIGFSRTSWYVETALVSFPELFKAATVIDGVDQGYVNYILFCAGMASCTNESEMANGGAPFGKTLINWIDSAPSFNLDKVRTPLRIEAINWYSIFQEWEIYSSLFQQHRPVDFVYISNGQHILQQPRQRYASQQGNVDWFRFWLQGFQDECRQKGAQYRRWTRLKKSLLWASASTPEDK